MSATKGFITGGRQFWQTATANTNTDGTLEIKATIDTKRYTISEASIRDSLQLEDATGITMLPNDELFEGMGQIGTRTCCCGSIPTIIINTSSTILNHLHTPLPPPPIHTPTPTPPPIHTPTPTPPPIPTPTPIPDTEPTPFEHIYEEPSPVHQHFSPPQEQASSQMSMDDLLQAVPKWISRMDSLETDLKQTKLTMGNAIVKLVKKVKKLEGQDDPLDSSVQGLVTPSSTKVNASGEEQVEDISPNTLEVAKTLSKVASLKPRSIDKGRRYKRRKEAKGKKVVSSLDFQEEVDTGAEQVNIEQVSTVGAKKSTSSHDKGQREGKAPMISEETPKKSKAKIEANAELSKSMLGSELQGEDFAKKMVDLVNQRKKYFAEERAKAKRNKPMTQSQLKTYMMNYLKNQGTWKLSQLKNLSFEEVKKEFDKLVKQVESFAPINFEATKASLKRFGEELQTKTPKRLKDDEAKDDESTKKSGKRRKQMARKGLHTSVDKDDSEGFWLFPYLAKRKSGKDRLQKCALGTFLSKSISCFLGSRLSELGDLLSQLPESS
ncbi:hypothetical protein Tco_1458147 [Tanacetum coccineum]